MSSSAALSSADRSLSRIVRRRLPQFSDKVAASGLKTARDLLSRGELELIDRLDLFLPEVRALMRAVVQEVAKPRKASQLLAPNQPSADGVATSSCEPDARASSLPPPPPQPPPLRPSVLPTGHTELDSHLGGGLPTRALCELVGPAGVGKTQCCLSMTARALVHGASHGARVLYVDTEGSFSALRLLQLIRQALASQDEAGGRSGEVVDSIASARAHAQAYSASSSSSSSLTAAAAEHLLDRVTVMRPGSWAQFTACLHRQLAEELMRPPAVALVVVDSIASAVREHFERGGGSGATMGSVIGGGMGGGGADGGGGGASSEVVRRQQAVGAAAARLKFYADAHATCILCVNQVVSGRSDQAFGAAETGDVCAVQGRDDASLLAYLGTAWAHCVNVRLMLQYPRFTPQLPPPPPPGVIGAAAARPMRLRVAKAPMAECEAEFVYRVTADEGLAS